MRTVQALLLLALLAAITGAELRCTGSHCDEDERNNYDDGVNAVTGTLGPLKNELPSSRVVTEKLLRSDRSIALLKQWGELYANKQHAIYVHSNDHETRKRLRKKLCKRLRKKLCKWHAEWVEAVEKRVAGLAARTVPTAPTSAPTSQLSTNDTPDCMRKRPHFIDESQIA
uniref:RxLR effector protein n=1 Tax=Steinernema glaseri TaxID=37863 RepID=A0A1I7XYX9_9BILA